MLTETDSAGSPLGYEFARHAELWAKVRFRFEDCELDTDLRELPRGAEPISISPQVFDLLVYLVRNRERVVSKDDLFETVWSGRIVSESTLTSHINAVRKAVGDSGEEQRLIRTIARKGFRFVGSVTDVCASGATAGAVRAVESPKAGVPPGSATEPALALPGKPSIAVLPFQNLSGDPAQDYFADGIVEDIITALSRMRWLFVIARNSTFTYKGRSIDARWRLPRRGGWPTGRRSWGRMTRSRCRGRVTRLPSWLASWMTPWHSSIARSYSIQTWRGHGTPVAGRGSGAASRTSPSGISRTPCG